VGKNLIYYKKQIRDKWTSLPYHSLNFEVAIVVAVEVDRRGCVGEEELNPLNEFLTYVNFFIA
jgi:hypothetical protein